ncbi:G1 family endopeptidase [Kitasatospora sp. NBC_01250]|uniref:G1 family glutamic endopeptidase n=1 Tax=Kitasatospora sp. NBC_01250 TaxID=2903571 RepID=UPI002E379EFF|nr:G1 family glutamic endopeptidase [Kitasatospora sp. NBC_01250]
MTIHRLRALAALAALTPALLTVAASTGTPAAAAAPTRAFPHHSHYLHDDQTWGGYAVTGGTYTSVSGSWTVPTLDCADTPDSSVSPWIGIDGFTSQTVEQIGFDQDCSNGAAGYYPWVEMYPADSIYFNKPVQAGDQITASVTVKGTSFTLTESDTTQHWTKTYHESGSYQLSSAEAIVEDLGDGVGPVADFGSIAFSNVTVNGSPLASAGTLNSTDLSRGDTPLTSNSQPSGSGYTINWLQS